MTIGPRDSICITNSDRQGQKLGQFMLMDALRRSLQNTREIGSIGVVVDAYDDRAERFYLHHEFRSERAKTGAIHADGCAPPKLAEYARNRLNRSCGRRL